MITVSATKSSSGMKYRVPPEWLASSINLFRFIFYFFKKNEAIGSQPRLHFDLKRVY